jgi:hypothetical protein
MAKVENRARLKAKFLALPRAMREQMREDFEKSAEEMVRLAKRLVAVKTGALRESIDWSEGDPPEGAVLRRKSEGGKALH